MKKQTTTEPIRTYAEVLKEISELEAELCELDEDFWDTYGRIQLSKKTIKSISTLPHVSIIQRYRPNDYAVIKDDNWILVLADSNNVGADGIIRELYVAYDNFLVLVADLVEIKTAVDMITKINNIKYQIEILQDTPVEVEVA